MDTVVHKVRMTKNVSEEDLKGWNSKGEWIVAEIETTKIVKEGSFDNPIMIGEHWSARSPKVKVTYRYPFSGSIADCNAWIQLREKGQIKFG